MFHHPSFDDHERVLHATDAASGLKAIIAIHDTVRGPALGGCRVWTYDDDDAALTDSQAITDALRLSRGMSYKSAMADLPLGGGKSVMIVPERGAATPAMFEALGRAIEDLSGKYIVAEDVGSSPRDLAFVKRHTRHVTGLAPEDGGVGDPSPTTAYGCFIGVAATARAVGFPSLEGVHVALQGLGNVGYGLRMRGVKRAEIKRRVAAALETVSLTGFEDRYPAQLSGGQQQRVAIARVMVLEPRVILLDEPFNALDAKLRGTMQVELRQLIKRLGMTAIFVTHDQEEALTMSDRIAAMRGGKIEQVAPPEEIFDRPASAYVADFIGSSNFWEAHAEGGRVALPDGQSVATDLAGPVMIMARPHNLRLEPAGGEGAGPGNPGPWRGTVTLHRSIGPLIEYHVALAGGATVRVVHMRQERAGIIRDGAAVTVRVLDPDLMSIYRPA